MGSWADSAMGLWHADARWADLVLAKPEREEWAGLAKWRRELGCQCGF